MRALTGIVFGAGLVALTGCSAGEVVDSDEIVGTQQEGLGSASIQFLSSSATGYCAKVTMQNALTVDSPRWQAILDMKGTSMTSSKGVSMFGANFGKLWAKPVDLTKRIAKNATTSFEFCGTSTSATQRPTIAAWNFESDAYAVCPSNSGVLPTLGALAVSAAREMKRWDPMTDFYVDSNWLIALTPAALAKCGNGCPNTKAILGQQVAGGILPQHEFNSEMFKSELYAAFDRHKNKIADLTRNNPGALPPAHKLTQVGGPINLGLGACGPHYIFQADNLDGTAMSAAAAANLANALCMNGQGSCGGNPYIHFVTTTQGCPSGRTCVAIDPTDGDNSSASTTTAGSAPTYPMNRAYDPGNALLNSACVTTSGKLGTMTPKCATVPSTCGYLYCIANP